MPANRHQRARDDKVDELVVVAQQLLIERGFEATTMAAVGKGAGIASNAVYWYFESKDHLFVAAMTQLVDRVVEDTLRSARRRDGSVDVEAGLVSFVERLQLGRGLIAAVHERSAVSPVVAEFHEQVHERYASLLDDALKERGVTGQERRLVVEALSTAVEGLVMHRATPAEARRMIRFLMTRLAPTAA